jgi:carbonic anhydrase/acetyltransferase-like protein (isoleucine patch superfamily)
MKLGDKLPVVSDGFLAPNASIIGDVTMADDVSVWYGAVIRGDMGKVYIGPLTNVQDRAVLSTSTTLQSGMKGNLEIGHKVTIGHSAVLNACTIEDGAQIGMGAVVMEGAVIGENTVIASGAVIPPGTVVPPNTLWAGNPAMQVRTLTDEEKTMPEKVAQHYVDLGRKHSDEFLPYGTMYLDAERTLEQLRGFVKQEEKKA